MNAHSDHAVFYVDLLGLDLPQASSQPSDATTAPDNRTETVRERDLATFWGVSDRQVRTLLSEGVIAKVEGGFYDKAAATQSYIRRLIEQASRRAGSDPELRAEKLRIAREQADQLELKNAAARGELVSAASVKSAWADTLRDVRANMLAVPSRMAQRLPHLTPVDLDHIDREIRDALQESANGNA